MTRSFCLLIGCILISLEAFSFSFKDLWLTPDQQGQKLMRQSQFTQAAHTFKKIDWAASASYRAKDYKQAALLFQQLNTEQSNYNQGNALAQLGQFQQAIQAYDKVLSQNPKHQDALYNRHLLETLLKKQQDATKQNKTKDPSQDQSDSFSNNAPDQNQHETEQRKTNHQTTPRPSEATLEKQQWLKLIPEDPHGLLREKFLRDHLLRMQGGQP